tara:strand:+ start:1482 stop:1619 length:138 start_codon:yes stop_codon:yes gene_type:complete
MQDLAITKYYIYQDAKKIKETYVKKDAERYQKKGYKVRSRTKKVK